MRRQRDDEATWPGRYLVVATEGQGQWGAVATGGAACAPRLWAPPGRDENRNDPTTCQSAGFPSNDATSRGGGSAFQCNFSVCAKCPGLALPPYLGKPA